MTSFILGLLAGGWLEWNKLKYQGPVEYLEGVYYLIFAFIALALFFAYLGFENIDSMLLYAIGVFISIIFFIERVKGQIK